MPWLVVKFRENNEVEVVPCSWFNRATKKCLYPTFSKTKLEKAIKQQLAPPINSPNDEWKEYPGELMSQKTYETFNIANAKATRACLTSDISDMDEIPLKRVPKKKLYDDEIYSDDDDNGRDTPTLTNFPKPPFNKKKTGPIHQSLQRTKDNNSITHPIHSDLDTTSEVNEDTSTHDLIEECNDNESNETNTSACNSPRNYGHVKDSVTFETEVMRYLVYHKKQLESIRKQVENLANQITNIQLVEKDRKTDSSVLSVLPVQSITEYEELQEKLKDKETFQSLVQILSRIGGTNYKDCIRRIMAKIMANDLAKSFTLHGHRENKQSFSGTLGFSLIIEALKIYDPKITERDIELQIGIWLTKAGERIKQVSGADLNIHTGITKDKTRNFKILVL